MWLWLGPDDYGYGYGDGYDHANGFGDGHVAVREPPQDAVPQFERLPVDGDETRPDIAFDIADLT